MVRPRSPQVNESEIPEGVPNPFGDGRWSVKNYLSRKLLCPMGSPREALIPDAYFHIFNHAVGHDNLFKDEENYYYFLEKISEWILPFCQLYSYCLMPNHFHLLLKVKDRKELELLWEDKIKRKMMKTSKVPPEGVVNPFGGILEKLITEQFSHCFNSYAQAYNNKYSRSGSLLKESFQRKRIDSLEYMIKVICYIHNNPVAHGFTEQPEEWKYSSYNALFSKKPTKIERNEVIKLFDSIDNLRYVHRQLQGVEL
jgi:REP element-mobilizing transposase RayT